MIVTVCIVLLFAKWRGYRLKPLLKAYALYHIAVAELFGLFFQAQIFLGNYEYVKMASTIKTVYMLLYILPVLWYKLYIPSIVGSGFILVGTLMNKIAIFSNGGKMPVYPTLSKLTGYFNPEKFEQYTSIHILGNAETKWKIFCDYIDVGYSILSIGDIFIRAMIAIVLYYSVKQLQNLKENVPCSLS